MEQLAHGEIEFRVHGPDPSTDEVSAGIFARQLATLVRALRAADKAANGKPAHDYVIARLHTSTPTALLAERPLPKFRGQIFSGHSGVNAFADCVSAITMGERDRALAYGSCAKQVSRFARVGYSEIWTPKAKVFRVDPFLTEQAESIVNPKAVKSRPETDAAREWFRGVAQGSFDGEVKAADLRGALPQVKLLLTAGGAQIDCVCRAEDIEEIRAALNHRARVSGRAIYDGKGGLPRRVEVSKISIVPRARDFARWKGAFRPFEVEPWEGDSNGAS